MKQELEEKYGHLRDRFEDLYRGQVVACDPWGNVKIADDINLYRLWERGSICLELTSLSDISDEDLDFICPHLYGSKYDELKEEIEKAGKRIQDHLKLTVTPPVVVDYLRSKGVALPFMGISVEELILLGWVKIKQIKSID